ncbi:MAG: hypothetical protein SFZ24_10760 [Planctomycetota bacterium]|nr:hypothetical protein [Planctomycetota bacterium]
MNDGAATSRRIIVRVLFLALLCAVTYTIGLTTHGLTNWQEGQRALVAREMHRAGEWLVPTAHGEPYLAKPPMIYWAQMLIAGGREALGYDAFVDEAEVRLAVALAGMLGVLATFFAARELFRGERWSGDDAAWWSALGLASGVLYVRSSRIGELDVLIVPFAVGAVGLVARAWCAADEGRDRWARWACVGLAAVLSTGAALTKGPPALLIVALAGYAPILLLAGRARASASAAGGPVGARVGLALLGGAALAAAGFSLAERVSLPWDMLGLGFFAVIGAAMGSALPGIVARRRAWGAALARTHPLLVMGVPVLVFWLWSRAVAARIGGEQLAALAERELDDNLRMLVLDSPTKNLGFMLYGVAPASIAAWLGAVWLVRERPALGARAWTPLVWTGLSYAAFSALGKGVARYLTPVWPGVAMLGGLWLAAMIHRTGAARLRPFVTAVFVVSALLQGWWYGYGREMLYADRSPRDLVREVMALSEGERPGRSLAVWKLSEPALDFYAGTRVTRWDERWLAENGGELASRPWTLLAIRDEKLDAALAAAGVTLERVQTTSLFRWRASRRPVEVWRVVPSAGAGPKD